jgi:hypothetical protein
MKSIIYLTSIFFFASIGHTAVDWSANAKLPGELPCEEHLPHPICFSEKNRANIYQYPENIWTQVIYQGSKHVMSYPVTVTPLQIPFDTLEQFFNNDTRSPLRLFFYQIAKEVTQFKELDDIYDWLGLHAYPTTSQELGPNIIPHMGELEDHAMGVTIFENGARGMTISCAACHSSNLFGTKVIGLTNRFPRANEFFILGQKLLSHTPSLAYQAMFKPTKDELQLFKNSKEAIKHVGLIKPLQLGLDTSLAQVGLSLSKRKEDAYASYDKMLAKNPRPNQLTSHPADSKPAVWWNVKYKTRWLSDGSIVSGNPIHTNFLWNEIGRGVDLKKLEKWLKDNPKTIEELTSYVFAAKAPRYNDFFPNKIDIKLAQKGEKLYLNNCRSCHGEYVKAWSQSGDLTYAQNMETIKVKYHSKTPVIDVGTDPHRYEGMRYFANDLNRLQISKSIGTVVEAQKGYVPPPLEGIWARWPYFHNNSVPTLYDVLTVDHKRPKFYIAVDAQDKAKDFDQLKNGYPHPNNVRDEYKKNKYYHYDATKPGLLNRGHSKMLLNEDGSEKFTHQDKLALIEFLKTL